MKKNYSTYLYLFLGFYFAMGTVNAQSKERKGVIFYEESNFNLMLRPRGMSFGYEKAKIKTLNKTTFYGGSIGYLRHVKELRQRQPSVTGSNRIFNAYIYGKQNSVITLRGMYGKRISLSAKSRYKGVSIGYTWSAGPTLALMKPYYISVLIDGEENEIKYTEETKTSFLEQKSITRSARYSKGLFEIRPVPGINLRSGIHLDWGEYDNIVRGADIGLILDLFIKPLPILVSDDNQALFLNLYVNLQIGSRK